MKVFRHQRTRQRAKAFTLIEVLIAGGILFMCLFAILALVANGVRNARTLQNSKTDPRSSIASILYYQLSHTNSLTLSDAAGSGEFGDYQYRWELTEVETNGLCQLDIAISPPHKSKAEGYGVQMLMYLPQMQQRPGGGAAR
jgi:Tfp pilus assembly protein PilV